MLHELKMYESNFERMKDGTKFREYRLYDEKRRLIQVGDTICFIKVPKDGQYLYADVVAIEVFQNWYDCYQKYFEKDFKERYATVQEVVDETYADYYTKEETEKFGCCCFTLSKVREKKKKYCE